MADAFLTRKGGENVTPEVTAQETIIQNIQEALVGKVYGANATPETILKGYSAYVHQNLVEGTLEMPEPGVDLLGILGFNKMAIDKVSFSSRTDLKAVGSINHSLGELPKVAIIMSNFNDRTTNDLLFSWSSWTETSDTSGDYLTVYKVKNNQGSRSSTSVGFPKRSNNAISIAASVLGEYAYFAAGVEYTLITMA